jgi:hypothetical protein
LAFIDRELQIDAFEVVELGVSNEVHHLPTPLKIQQRQRLIARLVIKSARAW